MYKLTNIGVKRLSDDAIIPNDPKNRDWRKYQKWIEEGNNPEPEFTEQELIAKKESEIKIKESEIVQAKLQFDAATEEGLSIAADYEEQLNSLKAELTEMKTEPIIIKEI